MASRRALQPLYGEPTSRWPWRFHHLYVHFRWEFGSCRGVEFGRRHDHGWVCSANISRVPKGFELRLANGNVKKCKYVLLPPAQDVRHELWLPRTFKRIVGLARASFFFLPLRRLRLSPSSLFSVSLSFLLPLFFGFPLSHKLFKLTSVSHQHLLHPLFFLALVARLHACRC